MADKRVRVTFDVLIPDDEHYDFTLSVLLGDVEHGIQYSRLTYSNISTGVIAGDEPFDTEAPY